MERPVPGTSHLFMRYGNFLIWVGLGLCSGFEFLRVQGRSLKMGGDGGEGKVHILDV